MPQWEDQRVPISKRLSSHRAGQGQGKDKEWISARYRQIGLGREHNWQCLYTLYPFLLLGSDSAIWINKDLHQLCRWHGSWLTHCVDWGFRGVTPYPEVTCYLLNSLHRMQHSLCQHHCICTSLLFQKCYKQQFILDFFLLSGWVTDIEKTHFYPISDCLKSISNPINQTSISKTFPKRPIEYSWRKRHYQAVELTSLRPHCSLYDAKSNILFCPTLVKN